MKRYRVTFRAVPNDEHTLGYYYTLKFRNELKKGIVTTVLMLDSIIQVRQTVRKLFPEAQILRIVNHA